MAENNSSNQKYKNNADGWELAGGTSARKLTVTGADVTLTGSGTAVLTFPSSTDTIVGRASTDTLTNKTITALELTAGTASAGTAPINLNSGTLLTTAEAGAMEMDATNIYGTTNAGNRGYIPLRHFIYQQAARTLTSSTAEQKLFNSVTNGTLTLETGLYFFHCQMSVTGLSATSGNFAFDILGAGTGVMGNVLYHVVGVDGNANTAATQTGSTSTNAQTQAAAVTAGTGTAAQVHITGTFEINTAGTIIPSITLLTAAAGTVAAGSYFMCERMGTNTAVSVGQWS